VGQHGAVREERAPRRANDDDGAAVGLEFQYFLRDQFGIDGIKPGKRFIQNDTLRLVQHRADELHFLSHAFAEILYFFMPPIFDFKFLKPNFDSCQRIIATETFQLSQVEELLSRTPLKLPHLEIRSEPGDPSGLEGLLKKRFEDLKLVGYESHGKIAAPVAV